jgi:hypothetical protein
MIPPIGIATVVAAVTRFLGLSSFYPSIPYLACQYVSMRLVINSLTNQ